MIRLMKFCIVGGINTLITLTVFYILNKILGINYMVSSLIGYISGMLNSFLLNKRWTFHNSDSHIFLQLLKFAIINTLSLGINLLAVYIFTDKFRFDSMISQVLATGFSTISNYMGSKLLVFSGSKEKQFIG